MVLARTALLVLFIVFVRCAACVCGVSLPGLVVDAACCSGESGFGDGESSEHSDFIQSHPSLLMAAH